MDDFIGVLWVIKVKYKLDMGDDWYGLNGKDIYQNA